MKVLVTGANGFVGAKFVQKLRDAGNDVVAATREMVGDINADTDWCALLQGVDIVIHTAARAHVLCEDSADPVQAYTCTNVDATENLARQAAQAGVKRFLFMSSINVLASYSDKPLQADDEPAPTNDFSRSKWQAEQALMKIADASELDYTIIRAPLVYGPGVGANFYSLLQHVDKQCPLPFACVNAQRDFVSSANLCDLVMTCIDHPSAANQIFLVADGSPISTGDMIKKLAVMMGRKTRMLPVPAWILFTAATLLGKKRSYHSVCSALVIDMSKTRDLLGWTPPKPLDDGLKRTVDWYLESVYAAHKSKEN